MTTNNLRFTYWYEYSRGDHACIISTPILPHENKFLTMQVSNTLNNVTLLKTANTSFVCCGVR